MRLVHKARLELMDYLVFRALQVQREQLVRKVLLELPELLDLQELKD